MFKYKVKTLYLSSISSIGANNDVKIINESHSWDDNKCTFYAHSKNASELEVWRGSRRIKCYYSKPRSNFRGQSIIQV